MSLCYDMQKWNIISLALVAIVLILGLIILVGEANGQALITKEPSNFPETIPELRTMLEGLINYCFEHADRPNPIQDLVDKKLIPQEFNGSTCEFVKLRYEEMKDVMEFALNVTRGSTPAEEPKHDSEIIGTVIWKYNQCTQGHYYGNPSSNTLANDAYCGKTYLDNPIDESKNRIEGSETSKWVKCVQDHKANGTNYKIGNLEVEKKCSITYFGASK